MNNEMEALQLVSRNSVRAIAAILDERDTLRRRLSITTRALDDIASAAPTPEEKAEEDVHPNNFYAGVQRGRDTAAVIAKRAIQELVF